eukprot:770648-Amphidinium_carterae.1
MKGIVHTRKDWSNDASHPRETGALCSTTPCLHQSHHIKYRMASLFLSQGPIMQEQLRASLSAVINNKARPTMHKAQVIAWWSVL